MQNPPRIAGATRRDVFVAGVMATMTAALPAAAAKAAPGAARRAP